MRAPKVIALLSRHMHASTQLPVRISFLILAALFALAKEFGFESIFGAFAAGMIVGQATRGRDGKPLREKIEGVAFGWFYPFFFVGIGIKFDATALVQDLATMLLVPTFAFLFLLARGVPVLLYRRVMPPGERLPFVLASAVPSLSIVVVITEIGTAAKKMNTDIAAALVGAALLSIMLYPTIAGYVLQRRGHLNPCRARRVRSPPNKLEIERALDEPQRRDQRDGGRAVDDEDALIERRRAEPVGNRQEDSRRSRVVPARRPG